MAHSSPFEALDFIYMPSRDVARDLGYYVEVLGAQLVFAIEAFGTRVAQVKPAQGGPRLLLAGHLEGDVPILVYRVGHFEAALSELEARGAQVEARFGIPHGPCATVHTPGGQRLAVYELTRPEADERLAGREDFSAEAR